MSSQHFTVKEIWRYPVKSMQGEQLTETVLTAGGVPLDRGWAVRDEATQTIVGAKKIAELLNCSAKYIDGTNAGAVPHVEITLPNGSTVRSDDTRVNEKLSQALGQDVTLWPLQPADNKDHYRTKNVPEDALAELRAVFALEPDEPLPDFSTFPPDVLTELMEFATPVGTYFDAFPLDILTEASLRHLQTLTPDAMLDIRRFRPNILVSDSDKITGLEEAKWVGQSIGIGEATVDAVTECPRCIMTTRSQGDLPRDASIMRAMVAHTSQNLSIYCNISKPGRIAEGDKLTLG
ncbi:MAG: MOSC N-terminal beta barrel domain-containing protein [Rhodobiaceae bacterium]|nr:MOSC N-terminal beta barrel domain-containing protein [Rhodobiaceae bacterium]